jgi:hypothetical protein
MILDVLMLFHALAVPEAPRLRFALDAAYVPQERAVDNWRIEGALSLEMRPMNALRLALGVDPREPPRCVKLNNYWCVKRSGWKGEIAADTGGHVAFASAKEGAAATALLLRRYYVDFNRRTAREIAARWAPAQCALTPSPLTPSPLTPSPLAPSPSAPAASAPTALPPPPRANVGRMLPQRPIPMGLAPHGIFNTLRARWLAAHGRGGAPRPTPLASRVKLASVAELAPAPEIAKGMGEPPHPRPTVAPTTVARSDPRAPSSATAEPPQTAPAPLSGDCPGERVRIDNYAARIAEGVAPGPNQDLGLFGADGKPTDKLVKVMLNMAAVEIGPLRASAGLAAFAVERMQEADRTRLEAR